MIISENFNKILMQLTKSKDFCSKVQTKWNRGVPKNTDIKVLTSESEGATSNKYWKLTRILVVENICFYAY